MKVKNIRINLSMEIRISLSMERGGELSHKGRRQQLSAKRAACADSGKLKAAVMHLGDPEN